MKRPIFLTLLVILATTGAAAVAAPQPIPVPPYVHRAVSDPHRPGEQVQRDADRHPTETIAFSGVRPGDRVADFMPGQGYFTRMFSRVVGSRGHVYAIIPSEMIRAGGADEFTGTQNIARDGDYSNVTALEEDVAHFSAPEKLDAVFTAQNYHDLYNMGHVDVAAVNKAVYRALRPGGVYLIVDHVAAAGSGRRETQSLHRIDPKFVRQEVTRAGFVFVGESLVLRNANDDHSAKVFDPKVRGHTDQVILKFRKPKL